jgi:hypothetical protein
MFLVLEISTLDELIWLSTKFRPYQELDPSASLHTASAQKKRQRLSVKSRSY